MHIAKLSYWFSGVFVLLCKTICGWECVYKTQSEDQSRIFCVLDWGVRGPDAKTQLTFWEKLPLLYIVRREIAIKLTWHSMHKSHTHTHTRQWASHRRRGVRECVRVCVCVSQLHPSFVSWGWNQLPVWDVMLDAEACNHPKATTAGKSNQRRGSRGPRATAALRPTPHILPLLYVSLRAEVPHFQWIGT